MPFTFQSFIKRTSAESLRRYFSAKKLAAAADVDWDDAHRDMHASLVKAIRELAQDEREGVLADFEEVHQLCDECGKRALRSMAGIDLAAIDQLDGNEARGLFMLTTHPREFRHALSIAYSERLYNGRTWSRFTFRIGNSLRIYQTRFFSSAKASRISSRRLMALVARC